MKGYVLSSHLDLRLENTYQILAIPLCSQNHNNMEIVSDLSVAKLGAPRKKEWYF